jgi:hypothetical protein
MVAALCNRVKVLREGRSLIELLAKGVLGDADLTEIINTLDSCVQDSALEVIQTGSVLQWHSRYHRRGASVPRNRQ